jgi:hypothetical protein
MGTTIEGVNFNGGDAWDHVTFRGVTLNKRTAAFLLDVEAELGYKLAVIQGSYHPGVSQSGGTHDKGGVFDCWDVFNDDPEHIQHVLRKHGGFAWFRPTIPGLWNQHIHCGVLGETDMSSTLAAQGPKYRDYLDGLASNAADNSWHPFDKGNDPKPIFDYPRWLKEQDMQATEDAFPGDDNKDATWGDLWRKLDHLDEFRSAVNGRLADQTDAIKAIGDDVDKQAVALGKVLDAVKAQGADIDALTALVKAL